MIKRVNIVLNTSYSLLPQAVDLIGEPGEDETQDKNSSHFDRLYFGFPYQTTHLYNEKKNFSNSDKSDS